MLFPDVDCDVMFSCSANAKRNFLPILLKCSPFGHEQLTPVACHRPPERLRSPSLPCLLAANNLKTIGPLENAAQISRPPVTHHIIVATPPASLKYQVRAYMYFLYFVYASAQDSPRIVPVQSEGGPGCRALKSWCFHAASGLSSHPC